MARRVFFSFEARPDDYLLFLGRIRPDKEAFEALQITRQSGRRLLLAGIVQDQAYFNECVQPYLSDAIEFLGPVGPEQRNLLPGPLLPVEEKAGNNPLHIRAHFPGRSFQG